MIGSEHHEISMAIAPLVMALPKVLPGILSLFSGIFGGKKEKQSAQKDSKGARLQDLMPLIMPLIQQQQQHSQQNYQQQQSQYQQIQPLQDAIARMSYGLMPTSAQGKGPQPYGPPKGQ